MLKAQDPVVLLQHGGLDSLTGKTGLAMLRHRQGPIVAVIDPAHAGQRLQDVTGIARSVPVVADLAAALPYGPRVAVVGLAPSGGVLRRRCERMCWRHSWPGCPSPAVFTPGWTMTCTARRGAAWAVDLGSSPGTRDCSGGAARAADLSCRRVLAVGTDMAVGKMSACLAVYEAALRAGVSSAFVGTGQAGS